MTARRSAPLRDRPAAWQPAAPDELRLFIALPLGPDVVAAVERLVEGLPAPADGRPVRWVRTDGLHLTLRFLGATPEERVPVLRSVVDDLAASASPFAVTISGGGAFPSVHRPRAIWLGVTEGQDDLAELAAQLGRRLTAAGWPPDERPFRAHLTLARADGIRSGAATASALIAAASAFGVSFVVDRAVLFRSHTGGGPARYEALHEAVLGS